MIRSTLVAGLIAVMAGGLAVTTLGYKWIFRRSSPVADDRFHLPTRRQIDLPLVGGAALFLASDLSSAITGEVMYVDCGYNIMGY